MTNEIKTVSSATVNEINSDLVNFKENKDNISKKGNKEDFEQLLRQIKLLMHEGKLVANSGNRELTQIESSENLEELLYVMNNRDETDSKKENSSSQISGLLPLADIDGISIEELSKQVLLGAVDLGLNTQIITNNNLNIDEAQIVEYARKMGLNQKAIELLFKTSNKNGGFSNTQLLASLKNIAAFAEDTGQKKLRVPLASLSAAKNNLATNKISDLSEVKNKGDQRNTPDDSVKLMRQKRSNVKEKTTDRWTLTKTNENYEVNKKDESESERAREKLFGSFGAKVAKQVHSNKYELDLETDVRLMVKSIKLPVNSQVNMSVQAETLNNSSINSNSSLENVSASHLTGDLGSQNQSGNKESSSDNIDLKRYEQYLKLSEKLAENIAKRIIQQIKKGEWKINLSLRPKTLGNIEIELTLKGKQLEASFNVNQILTRELLQDGFSKLKDSLEKSGIDVANLDINHKKQDGKDGKPTNGKNYEVIEQNNSRDTLLSEPKPSSENFIISAHELNVLV